MTKNVYSVGQVNTYIKKMFLQDFLLAHIYVKGEVSNCKYHSSGHVYFTLKDAAGSMSAVMFSGNRKGLTFPMREGDNVVVLGSIQVYERDGKYQLYAKEILLDGAGQLYQEYERLKKELEEMGMFSKEYKKDIPKFVKKVGIVTASTGAAIQDIRNISHRRNPYVQLILYPALVQGEGAMQSIIKGIHLLDAYGVDVIIVGRGGGSIEDLWAFNEEAVARAIFECQTPIISAVGHETDTTIADYVADLRAPTPSAAAELAVYEIRNFYDNLEGLNYRFRTNMNQAINEEKNHVEHLKMRLQLMGPENKLNEKRQRIAELEVKLQHTMEKSLQQRKQQLSLYAQKLDGVSPLKQMQRGYSFVSDLEGHGLKSISQFQTDASVLIHLTDGTVTAKTQAIEVWTGEKKDE